VQTILASNVAQNNSADEITQAVSSLNDLSKQNNNAAKKMAVFSEEIEQQANKLKQMLKKFNV
jgi:methyl-accepting chemotaxis protein